jgi:hypothetical protein
MRKRKSSLSQATSYKEIGEFWDTHDLSDFWDKTKEAQFEVDIESEVIYYAVDIKRAQQTAGRGCGDMI